MRRFCALAVCVAMVVGVMPVPVAAAVRARQQVQTQGGTVQGVARDARQQPIRSAIVQLRNVQTGQIAATGTTDSAGNFAFTNIPAGSYIVEVVDSRGAIVAMTAPFAVTSGAVASVPVTASAALGAAAAAGGSGGLFGLGTTGTILTVASAAAAVGITAMVVTHGGKIVICHKPAGESPQTIEISENARDQHLAHGDTLGACPISLSR